MVTERNVLTIVDGEFSFGFDPETHYLKISTTLSRSQVVATITPIEEDE